MTTKSAATMTKLHGSFLLRGCPRCGGDLLRDTYEKEGVYTCLQCARSYSAAQLEAQGTIAA